MKLWHRLIDWFSASRLRLGEAKPISGDVVISFRGKGAAQFRVQHARDRKGIPDELSWADVTRMSDRTVEPRAVIDRGHIVHGLFVDHVNGDRDAFYRRHKASWIRVIANEDNPDSLKRCRAYTITMRPAA